MQSLLLQEEQLDPSSNNANCLCPGHQLQALLLFLPHRACTQLKNVYNSSVWLPHTIPTDASHACAPRTRTRGWTLRAGEKQHLFGVQRLRVAFKRFLSLWGAVEGQGTDTHRGTGWNAPLSMCVCVYIYIKDLFSAACLDHPLDPWYVSGLICLLRTMVVPKL